ncbi:GR25 family glycosyltransferase involved in LPS biosynthesis [Roseiarcus fermentans]|uniref:GR25 family glycosyltransferase involved in LPS biosynthesis n=1 Tax=Roseiarcus fermentans TaxID=1473586 RepID=A0A366FSI2_9HYPH|nr:glycosyltransferase family 25 protein [Roseiarcus fermentans]RBP17527.1 GR25 family glycosyltransferase involved in LPS biosynthesis [Roseiarcus fermentans]
MLLYVINLDRDRDRLAHTREQLAGLSFTRVPAVDGTTIPETAKGLTRFELACLASHRDAWRRFLAAGDAHACFLEDDLHIWPGFAALVGDDAWVPADAHSVKLDTYFQQVRLGLRRPVGGGREVARLYSRHESSAAYVLSRAGAQRYLDLTDPPALPADYSLFPKNARRLGLRIYQLAPAVAIQDHLRPAAEGGGTFATAMNPGAAARKRRRPVFARLLREGARLLEQIDEANEDLYLRYIVKAESTAIPVG